MFRYASGRKVGRTRPWNVGSWAIALWLARLSRGSSVVARTSMLKSLKSWRGRKPGSSSLAEMASKLASAVSALISCWRPKTLSNWVRSQ